MGSLIAASNSPVVRAASEAFDTVKTPTTIAARATTALSDSNGVPSVWPSTAPTPAPTTPTTSTTSTQQLPSMTGGVLSPPVRSITPTTNAYSDVEDAKKALSTAPSVSTMHGLLAMGLEDRSAVMPAAPDAVVAGAVTRDVGADETVLGQLDTVLAQDSPLLRRAVAGAQEHAASRGLLNSSIAATAGQAAAIDAAMPVAQADAATYARQALTNQANQQSTEQFNADWGNKLATQGFAATLDNWLNNSKLDKTFAQTLATSEYENAWRQQLAYVDAAFKEALTSQTISSDLTRTAADLYARFTDELNRVLVDPELTADTKAALVNNMVTSMQRFSGELQRLGTPLPELDFSMYYAQ